jgi:hypothetical protein
LEINEPLRNASKWRLQRPKKVPFSMERFLYVACRHAAYDRAARITEV